MPKDAPGVGGADNATAAVELSDEQVDERARLVSAVAFAGRELAAVTKGDDARRTVTDQIAALQAKLVAHDGIVSDHESADSPTPNRPSPGSTQQHREG